MIWEDRKRIFGKPFTFTKYALSDDRLFIEEGILSKTLKEFRLYRISELFLTQTLFQRIFDEGDIHLKTDSYEGNITLRNVHMPREIMDMISYHCDLHRKSRVRNVERFYNEEDNYKED